jgi:integrase
MVKPTIRRNTLRTYDAALRIRILPELGETPLTELSRRHVKAWYVGALQKYKPGTVHLTAIILHVMLEAAVEDEVIPANPCRAISRAMRGATKVSKKMRKPPLTSEQLRDFLEAARKDLATYHHMVLLAYTGLRLGEAVGLQWGDLDFARKTIKIQRQVDHGNEVTEVKTLTGAATIPMAEQLRKVLWTAKTEREILEDSFGVPHTPWVLYPEMYQGMSGITARKRLHGTVKATLQRAGLPTTFSCHSLRHTIATTLL